MHTVIRRSALSPEPPILKQDAINVHFAGTTVEDRSIVSTLSETRTNSFVFIIVSALLLSGTIHACLAIFSELPLNHPLSFRKAALFGVSTGLTLWSCDWCFRQLPQRPWHLVARTLLSMTLFIEVALITLQPWRGETSHFNRNGTLNTLIEQSMLVMITVAMGIILVLWLRCLRGPFLPEVAISSRSAIRWGLGYLVISGFIGAAITRFGYQQLEIGNSHELWGERGVLKYPHGVTLHAVQTLAIVSWLTSWMPDRIRLPLVRSVAAAHAVALLFACYNTFRGMGRFELSSGSIAILVIGVPICLLPFLIKVSEV